MAKKLTKAKAREILHDKEVHGHPLTDKQRRFFGAVSSGYIKAQNGIEGTMGGLTDKGFNFNPAWGGAWKNGGWLDKYADGGNLQPPMAGANQITPMYAMGGSLPGSVGFTYARVAGAAPSEGPRAKKTMPSAQKGKNVDANQEFLKDWYSKRKITDPYIQGALELDRPAYMKNLQTMPEYTMVKSIDNDPNITGRYEADKNRLLLTRNAPEHVKTHELNHYLNNLGAGEYMRSIHKDIVGNELLPQSQMQGVYKDKYDYFSNPDEVHSRIMVLRQKAGFKPDEVITPEKLKGFMKTYKGDVDNINDLLNMSRGEEGLLNMLNFMAKGKSSTPTTAQNGAKVPVIEDEGSFNKDGVWIPDWEKMTAQAKKLGAKKVRTKHGSVIYFNDKWEVSSVDDNPDAKAQNGMEMKYYQEGLDWKPKTISKNGGWLDKYETPEAQRGILQQRYSVGPMMGDLAVPSQAEVARQAQIRKEAEVLKQQQIAKENIERQGEIKPHVPQSFDSKVWEIATNPVEALGYIVRGERLPEYFSKGQTRTSGLNAVVNTINPYQIINSGAEFLGGTNNIIEDVVTGDFKSAANRVPSTLLHGLGAAPMLSVVPKGIVTKGLQTLSDLPKAKGVKEVIRTVGGIPNEANIPRMAMDDVKALRQVQEIGRLKATGARSAEQMKYALENNLPEEHFQKVFNRSKKEAEDLLASGFGEQEAQAANATRERITELMNRPRQRNREVRSTLDNETMQAIDDFNNRPVTPELQTQRDRLRALMRQADQRASSQSTGIDRDVNVLNAIENLQGYGDLRDVLVDVNSLDDVNVLANSFANNINSSINKIITPVSTIRNKVKDLFNKYSQDYPYYSGEVIQKVPSLHLSGSGGLKNVSKKVEFAPEGIQSGDVFTGSTNTSHSSYLPQLKQIFKYTKGDPQFLGYRPMNEMGFLSNYGYTSEDIAKYLNSEIDEQIKRGIIPKNIQRPFLKKSLGPDRVILPHYGIKQHKQGGEIVKDDEGYWNPQNWGKPVEINSNEITMEGVLEPLLGISDTGDTQMMYPGKNYTFDGTKVVEYPREYFTASDILNSEIPVAQGGRQVSSRASGPLLPSMSRPTSADTVALYNQSLRDVAGFMGPNLTPRETYNYIASDQSSITGETRRKYPNFLRWATRNGIQPIALRNMVSVSEDKPETYKNALVLYPKPKPKPSVKKETPKTETKKAPVKSVTQTTDQLGMFRNPNVELLIDQFGNYEWFRKDDPGDMVPVRRATREEIEYSKKQKQRNGGVSVNKADEYPLEKLDNLLNFTNYNKPTAKNGKWLDKYK